MTSVLTANHMRIRLWQIRHEIGVTRSGIAVPTYFDLHLSVCDRRLDDHRLAGLQRSQGVAQCRHNRWPIGAEDNVTAINDHLRRVDIPAIEVTRPFMLSLRRGRQAESVAPSLSVPVIDVEGEG